MKPKDHLRSPKWERFEKEYIEGKTCAVCGSKKKLNAHHILPFHVYPELELKASNLIPLCRQHHLTFGHIGNWKGWNPLVRRDARTWAKKGHQNRLRIQKYIK